MRKIKFRGKRVKNNEWVYGYLVGENIILNDVFIDANNEFGVESYYLVKPETVGQYTGLNDMNDVEIFDDDIVQDSDDTNEVGVVIYGEGAFYVIFENIIVLLSEVNEDVEIIGNIHDNPEMVI